jgi:hypothetical protein
MLPCLDCIREKEAPFLFKNGRFVRKYAPHTRHVKFHVCCQFCSLPAGWEYVVNVIVFHEDCVVKCPRCGNTILTVLTLDPLQFRSNKNERGRGAFGFHHGYFTGVLEEEQSIHH